MGGDWVERDRQGGWVSAFKCPFYTYFKKQYFKQLKKLAPF